MTRRDHQLGYVDSMRGLAILMVMLVHTAQQIPNLSPVVADLAKYSQMGVQLFFVTSAYTLCLSFERRAKEPIKILAFYIRRFARIAPLYYLAIPIYFVFHVAEQIYENSQTLSIEPYSIFNLLANFTFIHGFMPSANNSIVPGGWSIGSEMIFYLGFPLLFTLAKKVSQRSLFGLFSLLLLCIGVNLSVQVAITQITGDSIGNNTFRYFCIINQFPVFMVGILAYSLSKQKSMNSIFSSSVLSGMGFVFFTAVALLLWKSTLSLAFALIPISSGLSFLFLLNWLKMANRQIGSLCQLGRLSYSMYLVHFLFAWGLIPMGIHKLSIPINPDIELLLAFGSVIILTFSVARISEKLIEQKGISAGETLIACLHLNANQSLPETMHSSPLNFNDLPISSIEDPLQS